MVAKRGIILTPKPESHYKQIEEYKGVAFVAYRRRFTLEIHKSKNNSDHVDEKEKQGNDNLSQHSVIYGRPGTNQYLTFIA